MMNSKISSRYAKALLLVGQERGDAHLYIKDLTNLRDVMKETPLLQEVLESPLYAEKNRRKILAEVIGRMGMSDAVQTFLLLVFDNGRITLLENIIDAYQNDLDAADGIVRAEIRSAVELKEEMIASLQKSVEQSLQKKTTMTANVDESLIGGAVIRIGHTVMDGSLRMKLNHMKDMLIQET